MKQLLINLVFALLYWTGLGLESNENYIIGYEYPLSWNKSDINSSTIDIVLMYGDNLQYNWTLAKNVSNDGSYNVSISLNNTLIQFNIPNNTTGQFFAKYSNKNMSLSNEIRVLQAVIMENFLGGVTSEGTTMNITIKVAAKIVNSSMSHVFFAQYITLTHNDTKWKTQCNLVTSREPTPLPTKAPTKSPTKSPTKAPTKTPTLSPTPVPTTAPPTTAAPTTAAPTTPQPTTPQPTTAAPTTAAPTTAAPTTAAPTTAAPTTAAPTTAAPTTTAPTTAAPTTAAPTTTTAAPTTAAPTTAAPTTPQPTTPQPTTAAPTTAAPTTAAPTTPQPTTPQPTTAAPTTAAPTTAAPTTPAPTTPAPTPVLPPLAVRRAKATFKRNLLQEDNEYYSYQVNITIPSTSECAPGGPYLLSVGIQNANATSTYQFYTINSIDNPHDTKYQFLNYNPSNFMLNMTVNNKTQNNLNNFTMLYNFSFAQFDDVKLMFNIDDEISNQKYYVVMENMNTNSSELNVLACESQRLSQFSSFGWKGYISNSSLATTFPNGSYIMEVYWSANQNWSYIESNSGMYQLNFAHGNIITITNETVNPVKMVNSDKKISYERGKHSSVTFTTSFNLTTILFYYFEQCVSNITINETIITCTSFNGTSFTYSEYQQKVTVSVPHDLTVSSDNKNMTTYLHVYTYNCLGNSTIPSTFIVNITSASSSSSSSSSLPPGAIVGIVCAGVLVLGLAAWWFCMRKPQQPEPYKKLDD